jgi:hypothetical protein
MSISEVMMNEIRVKRMLLAGLATFVVWIAAEILLEHVIGRLLLGSVIQEQWQQITDVNTWGPLNHCLNIFIALMNTTILIWLYASLRPMYGVGTKTALITCALCMIWVLSLTINIINLGIIPVQAGLTELGFELIECPIAMIAGAGVYEGRGAGPRNRVDSS